MSRPCKLQINTSGAWRDLLRFDIDTIDADALQVARGRVPRGRVRVLAQRARRPRAVAQRLERDRVQRRPLRHGVADRVADAHELAAEHEAAERAVSILSGIVADPHGYGRVLRNDEGDVEAIVDRFLAER